MRALSATLLCLTLAGCAAEPPAGSPDAPVPVAERAGWLALESTCGFRLLHPPGWDVAGTDAMGVFVLRSIDAKDGLSIVAAPADGMRTLAARSVGETFNTGTVEATIVEVAADRMLGADSTRFTLHSLDGDLRLTMQAVELDGGGLIVVLREAASPTDRAVFETLERNGPVGRECREIPAAALDVPDGAPWDAYASPAGWRISHPADWTQVPLSSSGEALVLLTPQEEEGFRESLTVIARPNTPDMGLRDFTEEYVTALDSKYADFELVSLDFGEKLGFEAARIESWETHIGGERWFARVLVVQPDAILLFEGEFDEAFGEHYETMSRVVDTFRFDAVASA